MISRRRDTPGGPDPRPSRRRYRAVFVSPHLDDAVFSCGGTIAALLREGPVLVVNVFSAAPANVRAAGPAPDPARYAEEAAAGRTLGFESVCLREKDALLRDRRYRAMSGLFGWPTGEDLADVARLRRRLEEVLAGVECDELYAPLGVGGHVDHVLTHLACRGLAAAREVVHYEDSPYCFIPGAVDRRLRELGAATPPDEGRHFTWTRTWRRLLRTGMPMGPGPVRWLGAAFVAVGLQRLLARHEGGASAATETNSSPASRVLDVSEVYPLKRRGMQTYGSQFRVFFRDAAECDRLHLDRSREVGAAGGVCERVWLLGRPTGGARSAGRPRERACIPAGTDES